MHVYISNKNYDEFVSSYKALREKFKTEFAFSYTIIVESHKNLEKIYRYLIDNSTFHIYFMIDIEKLDSFIVRFVTRRNIALRININDKLPKSKISLLKKIKVQTRIEDKREIEEVEYKDNRHIIYRTKKVDTITKAHLTSLSLLKTSAVSCENSSCINKTIYYEDGHLYFCPFDKRSYIGEISDLANLYNQESFVEILKGAVSKRDDCKKSCKHYPICMGSCPLKIRSECIKEDFEKVDKEVKDFLAKKTPLTELENDYLKEIYYSYLATKSKK